MNPFGNLLYLRNFQRNCIILKRDNEAGPHFSIIPQEGIPEIGSFLPLENLRIVEMIWFDDHTLTIEVGFDGVKNKNKFFIGIHLFTYLLTQKMLMMILVIKKIITEFLHYTKPMNQRGRLTKTWFLLSRVSNLVSKAMAVLEKKSHDCCPQTDMGLALCSALQEIQSESPKTHMKRLQLTSCSSIKLFQLVGFTYKMEIKEIS